MQPVTSKQVTELIDDMKRKKVRPLMKYKKKIEANIVLPLSIIINNSIKDGKVPTELKIAKVIAFFKPGARNRSKNYRPISLLPALSKIYEKVVYKQLQLYKYFEDHFLTKYQFGFCKQHETSTSILNFKITSIEIRKIGTIYLSS